MASRTPSDEEVTERQERERKLRWPLTPSLDRMQAPHSSGVWTKREGEPCRLVDHSQLVGDFLDWLHGQGLTLAKWGHETILVPIRRSDLPMEEWGEKPAGIARHFWLHEVVRYDEVEQDEDVLLPDGRSVDKLLHEYFQIDPEAEEREKRAVLAYVREGGK